MFALSLARLQTLQLLVAHGLINSVNQGVAKHSEYIFFNTSRVKSDVKFFYCQIGIQTSTSCGHLWKWQCNKEFQISERDILWKASFEDQQLLPWFGKMITLAKWQPATSRWWQKIKFRSNPPPQLSGKKNNMLIAIDNIITEFLKGPQDDSRLCPLFGNL